MGCWLLYSRRKNGGKPVSIFPGVDVSKLFGDYIRSRRESIRKADPEYSIRKVAKRIGIHHSYLSKIERGEPASLCEKRIIALAEELGDDPELLLAMNGKVSEAVRRAVFADPERVVSLLNQIKSTGAERK
ncbi:MAG: helix-turn-helix domain-containing protein [Pseudodesulfovibrio sp.]|nr:helix-turn-helix domain-containing protein [Pseudomonadota bacterium]MBV1765751.1 helix-turn-helix domain-containing protein [Pseudodesulfovibrio sp.]MBU4244898.1 helix-turn-helix domain-containing protein [Pseudomonadota bacterium]MBU4379698.1 helix-turn-helix domain-containing protein [Pseudomonadota bacterium]MBU4475678.1 helix-turn-helix domain-containing protein [Pseudomonadota bacterium]